MPQNKVYTRFGREVDPIGKIVAKNNPNRIIWVRVRCDVWTKDLPLFELRGDILAILDGLPIVETTTEQE